MKLNCKCGEEYLSWNITQYKVKLYCYSCGHNITITIPNHIPRLQWVKYAGEKLK